MFKGEDSPVESVELAIIVRTNESGVQRGRKSLSRKRGSLEKPSSETKQIETLSQSQCLTACSAIQAVTSCADCVVFAAEGNFAADRNSKDIQFDSSYGLLEMPAFLPRNKAEIGRICSRFAVVCRQRNPVVAIVPFLRAWSKNSVPRELVLRRPTEGELPRQRRAVQPNRPGRRRVC